MPVETGLQPDLFLFQVIPELLPGTGDPVTEPGTTDGPQVHNQGTAASLKKWLHRMQTPTGYAGQLQAPAALLPDILLQY